jgi:exonuclease SbcC
VLPISLTLRNFLSYREAAPTLRLGGVHVACLCGANGTGKSALLDAITWALWGKARGQRQDQLLHHGQDEMSVELEFDIGQEHYRVTRRYSRARNTPQTSLELGVLTGDDYRPITGDTIGETQADIIRRTNMDYDTFVNSAFLVQGRADMFAMSTPTQRKEVLSRVLGLGIYDRLEERAKLHGRELQVALSASAFQLDRLREQAGQAEGVRATLVEVQEQLQTAQQQAALLGERLALLRTQVGHLERRRTEALELDGQTVRAATRRDEAQVEVQELGRRLNDWRQVEVRDFEIQQGYADLQQAREQLRTLNLAAQSVAAIHRDLSPLEQQLSSARASLESQIGYLRHRLERELTPKVVALNTLKESLAKTDAALAEIDKRSVAAGSAQAEEQALRLEARRLEMENDRIIVQGKEARGKLDMLTSAQGDAVTCPVCGTELDPDGRHRIETRYSEEIESMLTLHKTQAAEAQRVNALADGIDRNIRAARERTEGERRLLDADRALLILQLDEAMLAETELPGAQAELAEAEERLQAGGYLAEQQADARRLRTEIADLAFDSNSTTVMEQMVQDLMHWDGAHQALLQAQARRPEDEAALGRVQGRMAEAEVELIRVGQQRGAIEREVVELDTYRTQRVSVEHEAAEAGKIRDGLQERRGSLSHRLEEIVSAEAELKEKEVDRTAIVEEAGAYSELALAFGKGGVQSLLIEAAIPRLEDEANDLLKQMTDGRMSLKVETQRARRTGRGADGSESIETLEIVISDELGARNYEMFSGGERFRVDFAIRIALSKLLAWRAGAPLPTLFIDEGFGTQDVEGRDRILDVIKAIEDRFLRILVITHLDEIKEAFPVRIEVSRTNAGSTFAMS